MICIEQTMSTKSQYREAEMGMFITSMQQ